MSDEWLHAEEHFHNALDLDPNERAALIARLRASEPAVAESLVRLLEGHSEAESGQWLTTLEPPDLVGRTIGDFELVRIIGRGGSAAVYEANQLHPQRPIAFKVIRTLPGARRDTARFELEGEAMSRLRHPGIAQIFAAGTEEDHGGALVWFALELLADPRGLLEHCRDKSLGRDARLDLFDRVLAATEYGHSRGVVHRDFKPSNILVDEHGAPKVIDFGIARALGDDVGDRGLQDETDRAGTLAYMSPERLEGGPADDPLDPRADVYSLGVVLFQLLSDEHPHDLTGLDPGAALQRLRAESATPIQERAAGVSTELAAVVRTALATDPAERYQTVAELRADLARARSHYPILAVPPSAARRSALFLRRNAASVTVLSTVGLSLIAVAVISTRASMRERRLAAEEHRARVHAERVSGFMTTLFSSARPQLAVGNEVTVREILDDAAMRVQRDLEAEPAAQGDVLATIGTSYALIGRIEEARSALEAAQRAYESVGLDAAAAGVQSELGFVAASEGRFEDSLQLLEAARARLDSASPRSLLARAKTLQRIALAHIERQEFDRAKVAIGDGLRLVEEHESIGALYHDLLTTRAEIAVRERDFDTAIPLLRDALEGFESSLPPLHHSIGMACNGLANALFQTGDVEAAREHWERALTIFEATLDPEHPDLSTVVGNVALAYARLGDRERAAATYERATLQRRAALGDHPRLSALMDRHGWFLVEGGDLEGARERFEQAVAVQRRFLEQNGIDATTDHDHAMRMRSLAIVHLRLEEPAPALDLLGPILEIQRATLAARHPELATTLTMIGAAGVMKGSETGAAAAVEALEEALAIRGGRPPRDWLAANTAGLLGAALGSASRFDEGEALLLEAYPILRSHLGAADFRVRDTAKRLADLYADWGREESAAEWREAAGG